MEVIIHFQGESDGLPDTSASYAVTNFTSFGTVIKPVFPVIGDIKPSHSAGVATPAMVYFHAFPELFQNVDTI